MKLTPAQVATAKRFMDLVNSDAFDAAFEDGKDPFTGPTLRAAAEWFGLRSFNQHLYATHTTPTLPTGVKPGDIVVLQHAWPGDTVGVVTEDTIELVGDDVDGHVPGTFAEWFAVFDAADLVFFNPYPSEQPPTS